MKRKIRIDYDALMKEAMKPLPTFQDVYREAYLEALKETIADPAFPILKEAKS